ncbi:MAG: phosphate/phosphite/phosphonate ABC transporter substrate-binding protein [Leptolyngbyaceae cyanobacterium]
MRQLRQFFLVGLVACGFALLVNLGGCNGQSTSSGGPGRLVVGLVSYDAGAAAVEAYAPFEQYLETALATQVELEPVFNELRAVEQIQSQAWDMAFAPAGLAAIAIAEAQYIPIFALEGNPRQRSVIVVSADSVAEKLSDLASEVIALGEPGSATGYYLPLYDLYGLAFSEIRFAPTPKTILAWVAEQEVMAGALSEEAFQQLRNNFGVGKFRILHQSRTVNNGAVLLSPSIERNQQQLIEAAMRAAPANVAFDAGYVANISVPAFDNLIQLVEKVRPLEEKVREQPAVLILEGEAAKTEE